MKTPEEIAFAHGKAWAEANKPRCLPPVAAAIDKAWYEGYDSAGISRVRAVDAKQATA